jgi:N6-adenosine-specific RNA methylase IME4
MSETDPFAGLPRRHFRAIYADPPWAYEAYSGDTIPARAARNGLATAHYQTMPIEAICALPVAAIAAADCVLFVWVTWPTLENALALIKAWGFDYKTCAFSWVKADARQTQLFHDDVVPYMGLGYWTRANSEVCLLATRGNPKRLNADVRQAIIEPRREHSRKPDCVPARIERLVKGPYLELFSRTQREGWTMWGNQIGKFDEAAA